MTNLFESTFPLLLQMAIQQKMGEETWNRKQEQDELEWNREAPDRDARRNYMLSQQKHMDTLNKTADQEQTNLLSSREGIVDYLGSQINPYEEQLGNIQYPLQEEGDRASRLSQDVDKFELNRARNMKLASSGGMDALGKIIGNEGMARLLGYSKEENPILASGPDYTISRDPSSPGGFKRETYQKELDPKQYLELDKEGGNIIDLLTGEATPITNFTPQDKQKAFGRSYQNYMKTLNSGTFDLEQFYGILNNSDEKTKELLLRQTATWMQDHPDQADPNILSTYNQMLAEDEAKNKVINTLTVKNEDGTETSIMMETDKKTNKQKELMRIRGTGGKIPNSAIDDAVKRNTELSGLWDDLQAIKGVLKPSTVGLQGFINRMQGKIEGIKDGNYNPTPEQWESFKRYLLQEQESLQQARTETGTQRTVQEIDRIKKAYGAGEITFWEAKAAIEILEESIEKRFGTNDRIIQTRSAPTLSKPTPFYDPSSEAARRLESMKKK